MATPAPDDLFKDPHSHVEPLGTLTCKVDFVVSEKFLRTCSACSNLADVWDNDNQSLQKGIDNFNATLEKILQMLDTFIREKCGEKNSGIHPDNFSPSNDCELTLLLLWQMRNIMTHNGGIVDAKCKKNCSKIIQQKGKTTQPIIPLLDSLEISKEFVIRHKDFEKIKDCVFCYIKQRVSEEDYSIFASRATTAHFQITGGFAYFPIMEGKLVFSIRKASAHGINIDPKTGRIIHSGATFSIKDNRIHLRNGDSFPAQYIPDSEYDEKKIPGLGIMK